MSDQSNNEIDDYINKLAEYIKSNKNKPVLRHHSENIKLLIPKPFRPNYPTERLKKSYGDGLRVVRVENSLK